MNYYKIVVPDEWFEKRFSEFVSRNVQRITDSHHQNSPNQKNPDVRKSANNNAILQFTDNNGKNLSFSLSFFNGNSYICWPYEGSSTIRRIINVEDLFARDYPGETLTVKAMDDLVKEYLVQEFGDSPKRGGDPSTIFSSFVRSKELEEWRNSKQNFPRGKETQTWTECSDFLGPDIFLKNDKKNERDGDSPTENSRIVFFSRYAQIKYCRGTKDEIEFDVRDKEEPTNIFGRCWVSKEYLRLLTKKDFLERIDLAVIQDRYNDVLGPIRIFGNMSVVEEYFGETLPGPVLKKIADIGDQFASFFVRKNYEKNRFEPCLSRPDPGGRTKKISVVLENSDNIKTFQGRILILDSQSFVASLDRQNDRDDR